MNEKLINLIESAYELAKEQDGDEVRIKALANQACGACCYEYLLTDDIAAMELWGGEWKEKFEALLEK